MTDWGQWINTKDRQPELRQKVWILFTTSGKPSRRAEPILSGIFIGTVNYSSGMARRFTSDPADNCLYDNLYSGATHWQPREEGDAPPLPLVAIKYGEEKRATRHYWTPEEDAKLRELKKQRKSNSEIAAAFGLNYGQISSRLHTLRWYDHVKELSSDWDIPPKPKPKPKRKHNWSEESRRKASERMRERWAAGKMRPRGSVCQSTN